MTTMDELAAIQAGVASMMPDKADTITAFYDAVGNALIPCIPSVADVIRAITEGVRQAILDTLPLSTCHDAIRSGVYDSFPMGVDILNTISDAAEAALGRDR